MKTISATEFKAKCLAIMDEIQRTGEPVTVLKRGKPVVEVSPPPKISEQYPQYRLQGSVEILGDIVEPPLPADVWDANRGEL